jgi:hypothetical protein
VLTGLLILAVVIVVAVNLRLIVPGLRTVSGQHGSRRKAHS